MGRMVGLFGVAVTMLFLGCGSGLSTSDATVRCDQERTAKSQCVTDTSYQQCLSCEEQCGDDCIAAAQCPESYACP